MIKPGQYTLMSDVIKCLGQIDAHNDFSVLPGYKGVIENLMLKLQHEILGREFSMESQRGVKEKTLIVHIDL